MTFWAVGWLTAMLLSLMFGYPYLCYAIFAAPFVLLSGKHV